MWCPLSENSLSKGSIRLGASLPINGNSQFAKVCVFFFSKEIDE